MGYCYDTFHSVLELEYHDTEWGVPVHDDRRMFEYLTLECLQCGLSWTLMLKKREIFRECFENFEFNRIASYGDEDVRRILHTAGMIRSERKILAVINNAKCFLKIREIFGSFCDYLWNYTGGKTIVYDHHAEGKIPVSNGLSDRVSIDLKRRGMSYIGTVSIYSFLQATGLINDHSLDCPCFHRINTKFPSVRMCPDEEA